MIYRLCVYIYISYVLNSSKYKNTKHTQRLYNEWERESAHS